MMKPSYASLKPASQSESQLRKQYSSEDGGCLGVPRMPLCLMKLSLLRTRKDDGHRKLSPRLADG